MWVECSIRRPRPEAPRGLYNGRGRCRPAVCTRVHQESHPSRSAQACSVHWCVDNSKLLCGRRTTSRDRWCRPEWKGEKCLVEQHPKDGHTDRIRLIVPWDRNVVCSCSMLDGHTLCTLSTPSGRPVGSIWVCLKRTAPPVHFGYGDLPSKSNFLKRTIQIEPSHSAIGGDRRPYPIPPRRGASHAASSMNPPDCRRHRSA